MPTIGAVLTAAMFSTIGGCSPKAPNAGPIEYVGGTDPHPGVPQDPEPAPALTQTTLPSERVDRSADASEQCFPVTDVAPLKQFFGNVPADATDDDVYNAVLQFMVASGSMAVEHEDRWAHTIVTKRFTGQTLLSTCNVNTYRLYALRLAIVGKRAIIDMDCWESVGWEAHIHRGTPMSANRGELRECGIPKYASKNDAEIPSQIFAGALDMLNLRRMTAPAASPAPSADEIRRAKWWCTSLGGTDNGSCDRTRERCEKQRSDVRDTAVLTDCVPRESATCFDMLVKRPDGSFSVTSCHPNLAACEAQRSFVATKSQVSKTSECRSVQ
jgi:hypothetical protein